MKTLCGNHNYNKRTLLTFDLMRNPYSCISLWKLYYPLANLSKLFWGDYSMDILFIQLNKITCFHSWFALCPTAGVDFKNSYDEWCILMQKAQDSARCLLKEYDDRFAGLKVFSYYFYSVSSLLWSIFVSSGYLFYLC